MTRDAIGTALVVLGVALARLVWGGGHLAFVKQSLTVPLYLSTAVLVVLGIVTLLEPKGDDEDEEHDHDHATPLSDAVAEHEEHGHAHVGHGPRMGVLLLAPLAVLVLVPAAPLGAFAAANGAANRVVEGTIFGDLPDATDGAVDLLLTEVIGRAVLEPDSIDGADLRTEGFVVPYEEQPGTYLLSRFTVGCCAVDAAPFQLVVLADGDVPAQEEWVRATLRFTGEVVDDGEEELPVFELVVQERIPEPSPPYIY